MNEGLFRSSAGFGVTGYSCQLYESPALGALECRKIPQCPKMSCPVMRQLGRHWCHAPYLTKLATP
jgi:hypothetical protein